MSVNSKMTAIADAIRAKTGGTELLTLDAMAQDIAAIDTSENLDDVLTEQDALIADIKSTLAEKGVKPEQTKTATPSLSQQTISPDSGKTLSGVTVEPITSTLLTSLDSDFKAENIAEGVDMFGLIGTLAASAGMQVAKGNVDIEAALNDDDGVIIFEGAVTGLTFAPTFVLLLYDGGEGGGIGFAPYEFVGTSEDEKLVTSYFYDGLNNKCNWQYANFDGDNVYEISTNGWAGPSYIFPQNNGFLISGESIDTQMTTVFKGPYDWIAIG